MVTTVFYIGRFLLFPSDDESRGKTGKICEILMKNMDIKTILA